MARLYSGKRGSSGSTRPVSRRPPSWFKYEPEEIDALVLNAGTAVTSGMVVSAREDIADVSLKKPICAEVGAKVALSRRIGESWRLIGFGTIR